MIIKNINEFELVNEGIFSFFKNIEKTFKSKKSQLETILEKIKEIKEEEFLNKIKIEKQIWGLLKERSEEVTFKIDNLNKQIESFSLLKEQEISLLLKEADGIIKDDLKLKLFFYSELDNIKVFINKKYIKNVEKYKDSLSLNSLNKEFNDLVRGATIKNEIYNYYKDKEEYFLSEDFFKNLDSDLINLLNLTTHQFSFRLKMYTDEQIKKIYKSLKELIFNLELKYQKLIDFIKKDIERFKIENIEWLIPSLEKEKINIKKIIKRIKYRINLIKEELKIREYNYLLKVE